MEKRPKTFNEHVDYVSDAAKLMLCFAWTWSKTHPEEKVVDILRKRTLISRYAGFNDKEFLKATNKTDRDWQRIAESVSTVCNACANNEDDFESRAFELVNPALEEYAERGFRQDTAPIQFSAGSLRYEPKPAVEGHPTWCAFHIANAMYPQSIFDDPRHLVDCFETLMDQSEKECGYDTLYTFTWLNSRQQWLDYFPAEWTENLSEPDDNVWDNLGYWGQIITARKTFNRKTGEHIRKTGELRYKPRRSHCSFSAMRQHLETMVK
ncbi:MAG: hypothetical protein K9N51_04600 [Candidatus Pacebacteria bacterium]|nr:hypothetical protein [Candidatus Paceibacterota bacterium]